MLRLLQEGQLKYVFAPNTTQIHVRPRCNSNTCSPQIQFKQTHVPGPNTTQIYTHLKYKQLKYNPLKYRRKKHLFAHMLSVHVLDEVSLQQMEQKNGFKKSQVVSGGIFQL